MRWLPVVGHGAGVYEVSEFGDVRRGHRVMNQNIDEKGRRYYRLSVGGRTVKRMAHRLVLEAFVGPADGRNGLHWDDNPANNHVSNLRWGTQAENMADRKRNNAAWDNGWNSRTACSSGHPYTEENTYMAPNRGRLTRKCRECRRQQQRRRRAR